jgi:hypothetical protein
LGAPEGNAGSGSLVDTIHLISTDLPTIHLISIDGAMAMVRNLDPQILG